MTRPAENLIGRSRPRSPELTPSPRGRTRPPRTIRALSMPHPVSSPSRARGSVSSVWVATSAETLIPIGRELARPRGGQPRTHDSRSAPSRRPRPAFGASKRTSHRPRSIAHRPPTGARRSPRSALRSGAAVFSVGNHRLASRHPVQPWATTATRSRWATFPLPRRERGRPHGSSGSCCG